jgi:hypothetical protein
VQPRRRIAHVRRLTIALAFSFVLRGAASACGISGSATRTDGSKVDGTARVTTSWNSAAAFPRDGWYSVDLGGGACGTSVELFVNGYSLGRVSIPSAGDARRDFQLKGTTDVPVR